MCTHRYLMLETNRREYLILARKGTEPVYSRKFPGEASRRESPSPGRDRRTRPERSTYRYEKAGFLRHVDVVLSNHDRCLLNLSIVIPVPSLPLDTNDQQAGIGDTRKDGTGLCSRNSPTRRRECPSMSRDRRIESRGDRGGEVSM